MLNRLLRQASIGGGGALQQALGPLLNIYNTAIMVIASFVIFWAVMSIVIDTAKTGHFGGGHNMVWFPIRLVFAMGLMIPVGAGFNSGQIIVLKIAEWGSNLGTNGWVAYVTGVASPSLISNLPTQKVMNTMVGFAKINTCRAAYNIRHQQSTGNLPNPPNGIYVFRGTDVYENADKEVYFYKNAAGMNCGSVEMLVPNPAVSKPGIISQATATLAGIVPAPFATYFSGTTGADETFQTAVRGAERAAFLAQEQRAMLLACDFNRAFITGIWPNAMCDAATPLPLNALTGGGGNLGTSFNAAMGVGPCGSSAPAAPGQVSGQPTEQCIIDMTTNFSAASTGAITGALAALRAYVSSGGFVTEAQNAGWGGMGMWYHKISNLNIGAQKAVGMTVTVKPPATINATGEIADYTNQVLLAYDKWWKEKSVQPSVAGNAPLIKFQKNSFSTAGTGVPTLPAVDTSGVVSAITTGVSWLVSGIGALSGWGIGQLLNFIMGGNGVLLVEISSYGQGTYPMAELSRLGHSLVTKAEFIYTAMLTLSLIPGISVMSGPVGSFLGLIAFTLYSSGAGLAYFLPLMPWMRVMFAVMGWLVSIFEAVIAVPLVALGHINSKGEGLAGGMVDAYKGMLMILLRPILVVFGYVGSLLLFNTMVIFINDTFSTAVRSSMGGSTYDITAEISLTVAYVVLMYALVNSSFKLVDMVPNTVGGWFGTRLGSVDRFGGESSRMMEGAMIGAMQRGPEALSASAQGVGALGKKLFAKKPVGATPVKDGSDMIT